MRERVSRTRTAPYPPLLGRRAASICASFLCAGLCAGARGQDCENFEPPALSRDSIYADFDQAVVRLEAARQKGTAYLIDSERGYLLTAYHVVRDAAGPDDTIAVSHAGWEHPLTAVHVANLTERGIDVALLQLRPPSGLAGVQALDLGLRVPTESRPVYTMGYPNGDSALSKQLAEAVSATSLRFIEVKQAAYPGDSGSPLIDEFGNVIGTAVSRLRTAATVEFEISNRASYVQSKEVLPLIDAIAPTKRVVALDEDLRHGQLSAARLSQQLRHGRSSLSNLELYWWTRLILQSPGAYGGASELVSCPILTACLHRRMERVVLSLLQFAPPDGKAEALLGAARQEEASGGVEAAQTAYAAALQDIDAGSASMRPAAVQAWLGLGRVRLDAGDLRGAEDAFNTALAAGPSDDEATRQAYASLASVYLKAGDPERAKAAARHAVDELDAYQSVEAALFAQKGLRGRGIEREFRSGPRISGVGKAYSDWYSVCSEPTPLGLQIESFEFRLTGDRQCGSWAECSEPERSSDRVCARFRMQGHDEWLGAGQALSEGVLTVRYR